MIEQLRVRILAGEAGEFSSPGLTLCADSYLVSVSPTVIAVARKRHGNLRKPHLTQRKKSGERTLEK